MIDIASDDIADAVAERGGDAHGEHEARERPCTDIDAAHGDVVDPAAAIAGERTEQGADRERRQRRRKGHRQIDTRGVDDARELIAAIDVGPEPVVHEGAESAAAAIGSVRIEGRDQRRQDGGHDQEQR